MEKPVSIDLRGTTVSELTDFRLDTVANEHQFFQITFNRSSLQTNFDLSAPASFYSTPVRLNFLSPSGKLRQITGNIISLQGVDGSAHSPEITIAGTFYSPSGKFPKLDRFVYGAIVLPILLMGSVLLYVNLFKDRLVEKRGTVESYSRSSSYKGTKRHAFRIAPFQVSLKRGYYRPIFNHPSERIDALFSSPDDGYHADSTGQPVQFSILKADVDKLSLREQEVPFFNLRRAGEPYSSLDQSLDILYYVKDQIWWYFVWLIYAFAEIAMLGFVFYYYRMFAFKDDPRKKKLFWSFAVLIVMLNVPVILMFI